MAETERSGSDPRAGETELLPCPFCGGAAEIAQCPEEPNRGCWFTGCTECQACTRLICPDKISNGELVEQLAELWNRRARLAPPEPGPGAVPSPDGPPSDRDILAALNEAFSPTEPGSFGFGDVEELRRALAKRGATVTMGRGSPDGGDLPALFDAVFAAAKEAKAIGRGPSIEWLRSLTERLAARGVGALPAPRECNKRFVGIGPTCAPCPLPAGHDGPCAFQPLSELGASRSGGGSGTVPGAGAIPPRRGVEEAMSIERFRRAVNKALYDHGEWVLSARYYRLPEEACEHLANASIASEKAVVAIYEAALRAGPPPDTPVLRGVAQRAVDELHALAQTYREDWSDFDGRQLRREIQAILEPVEAALRASPPLPQRIP